MYSAVMPDLDSEVDNGSTGRSDAYSSGSISLFDVGKRLLDGRGV